MWRSSSSRTSGARWSTDLTGPAAGGFFGLEAGTAGDVNGDGFADVVVGAYGTNGIGEDDGAAGGNEFTLDGRKAVMTVFTHRAGALRLKVLLCLVVDRHRGYVLVCTATEKTYPALRESFFKIMRSLKLEG